MEENESKKKDYIFLDNSAYRIPNWLKQAEMGKKMNKGLEAWERIKKGIDTNVWESGYWNDIELIEKKLKALDIIGNKKVNIFTFYECCSWHNPSHYNDSLGCPINYELTKEEYDLLKEVLL